MAQHLNEMQRYIDLLSKPVLREDVASVVVESDIDPDPDALNSLMEDISDVVFKLRSQRVMESNSDYALGAEEAFQTAADMLDNILKSRAG